MNKEKLINIRFDVLAIFCIIILGIALAPRTLQNDTYYTVKIGEYITQNGISDLTKDPFSWHEDLPYTFPHWGYDLGMYLIYNNWGFDGIYASTVILSAILGVTLYICNSRISKNRIVSLIISFGALYLMKDYIAARAQLVTFILFTLTVFFIEKYLSTKKIRYAIYLIIIPIIIANIHLAVFPFYFVLFLPYIAEFVICECFDLNVILRLRMIFWKLIYKITKNPRVKEKIELKLKNINEKIEKSTEVRKKIVENPYKIILKKNRLALIIVIVFIISAFTGFLTPVGDAPYTYLYKTMIGNTTHSINEHLPLTLVENSNYMMILCAFLAILIFTDTKIKLSDLFMLFGLMYLSFKSRRQISIFIIICAPILCKLISQMFKVNDDSEIAKKAMKFLTNIFGSIITLGIALIISLNIYKPHMEDSYVDSRTYPVAASEWILNNLDVKNIKLYNEYNYGSYLLFKGIPVFIDSRADLYAPEFNTKTGDKKDGKDIFTDALNIAGLAVDYNSKFSEYGVTHIITYGNSKLSMVMADDKGYKLLYQDDSFKIYERLSAVKAEE